MVAPTHLVILGVEHLPDAPGPVDWAKVTSTGIGEFTPDELRGASSVLRYLAKTLVPQRPVLELDAVVSQALAHVNDRIPADWSAEL